VSISLGLYLSVFIAEFKCVDYELATDRDGKTLGLNAPSSSSQEAAIREAYASAGISDFAQTAYFECHGTATKVGDPIEAAAIGSVFGRARHAEDPLYVGAVKTNIGHSEASSALSAVIKTVLAVESGTILPNVGFEKPNPKSKIYHQLMLFIFLDSD